jgi:hypothetical protein
MENLLSVVNSEVLKKNFCFQFLKTFIQSESIEGGVKGVASPLS